MPLQKGPDRPQTSQNFYPSSIFTAYLTREIPWLILAYATEDATV